MINLFKLFTLVLVFLVSTETACVQKQVPAPVNAPTGNQPPVIESLTANQNQTYPGGMVDIRSSVSDPNKDMVTYKWSCVGGNFRETGNSAVWIAPSQYGNYDITLVVDDGKGGNTQATITIAVSANNPPRILSVKADPQNVQLEGTSTITCSANDPDGDSITYSWQAKEGTINGQGNKVTWVAPRKQGSFTIAAVAKDNRGGESRQEVVVIVSSASDTITMNLIKQESGTVNSEGDKDTSFYRAGDDEKNVGYRSFFSFNIFQLQGMEIREARLKFVGTKMTTVDPFDPVTGIGSFQLRHFSYGSTLPKFDVEGGGVVERAETQYNKPLTDVDVTPELTNDVSNKLERFQVEAGFMKKRTNGNGTAEFVQWEDVILEVTAARK